MRTYRQVGKDEGTKFLNSRKRPTFQEYMQRGENNADKFKKEETQTEYLNGWKIAIPVYRGPLTGETICGYSIEGGITEGATYSGDFCEDHVPAMVLPEFFERADISDFEIRNTEGGELAVCVKCGFHIVDRMMNQQ